MANAEHKHYHDNVYDASSHFETYTGANKAFNEDVMEDIMEAVYKVLSSGSVKGDSLIDISVGLMMFPLFVAADHFKNITMIESSDSSIESMEKWVNKDPSAVDKRHIAEFACSLKGQSAGQEEQEDKVRNAIKHIVKWDIQDDKPMDSVVCSQADCLFSFAYLEVVCKDRNMYLKLLKQFCSLIKTGGHLILIAVIDLSYYIIGEHKFFTLKLDEEFVRKALIDSGFVIKSYSRIERKFKSPMTDYEHFGCFVACKV
ncbi:hypothetical protein GDO86_019636 [Hymenochirus boettgeri]|uniref:Uncharacterized protein n=1 Tax=Hymenochirus boettgeri TaxID=247094 RepID=A0A8T2IAN5_9PIPI|nr:hypothetical protein GDO86_019636 [Hymenochirus boettgeri]